jgi:hypothetical protein
MERLAADDRKHLKAAEAWLYLGNHVEANKDLDNITPESRSRPKVLGVRWEICARVRRRD